MNPPISIKSTPGYNRRVLTVDDDHGILEIYTDILQPRIKESDRLKLLAGIPIEEKSGYEVTSATQGERAVALTKEKLSLGLPYAVAFIDMRMPPGMDGLETAKALRSIDERVFIVIVTAYTDYSIEKIQETLGHDVLLLRKPFSEDELQQIARTLTDIWNRDTERLEIIERAKNYGDLIQNTEQPVPQNQNSLLTQQEQIIREVGPKPLATYFPDPIDLNIPRITLLGRDKTLLARMRSYFPQTKTFAYLSSTSFKRHGDPDIVICKIDDQTPRAQINLSKWLDERRGKIGALLYGPEKENFLQKHKKLLQGGLIGLLPNDFSDTILEQEIHVLANLRKAVQTLSYPDYPIIGYSHNFRDTIARANGLTKLGEPIAIYGTDLREVRAFVSYLHVLNNPTAKLHILPSEKFLITQTLNKNSHDSSNWPKNVFGHPTSGTLLIENIDILSTETLSKLIEHAQLQGIDLVVLSAVKSDVMLDRNSDSPLVIELPNLSQRQADIPLLINYFTLQFNLQSDQYHRLSQSDIEELMGVSCPPDMASLKLAVYTRLSSQQWMAKENQQYFRQNKKQALDEHMARFEAAVIIQVLKRCDGNVSKAGRVLGIRPNTLHYKLKRYGIVPDKKASKYNSLL